MVVWDESSVRIEHGAHDTNELVFDIIQNQARGLAFFGFAKEIGSELRTMSTNRTSRQVEQFANDGWTEMPGGVMFVDRSATGMLVGCDAQKGSQNLVVQRVLCQDEEVSGQQQTDPRHREEQQQHLLESGITFDQATNFSIDGFD